LREHKIFTQQQGIFDRFGNIQFCKSALAVSGKSGDAISLIAGSTASGAALAVVKQQPREEDGLMIREKGGGGGGPSGL
jgi:hypothetical protein